MPIGSVDSDTAVEDGEEGTAVRLCLADVGNGNRLLFRGGNSCWSRMGSVFGVPCLDESRRRELGGLLSGSRAGRSLGVVLDGWVACWILSFLSLRSSVLFRKRSALDLPESVPTSDSSCA